jgi:hypothetical protein
MSSQAEPLSNDVVLAHNWIWFTSLRRFLELVSSYVDCGRSTLTPAASRR